MLHRCNTEAAPWYVVPSDRKWYRNWAITAPCWPSNWGDVPALAIAQGWDPETEWGFGSVGRTRLGPEGHTARDVAVRPISPEIQPLRASHGQEFDPDRGKCESGSGTRVGRAETPEPAADGTAPMVNPFHAPLL